MNKRRLFFTALLGVSLLGANSQAEKKTSLSDFFMATLKTHLIEPSWVLPVFFEMDLQEFDFCWNVLATLIKQKPWYLVCSNYGEYSERQQRDVLIGHCKAYDLFLQNLFVNPQDNSMIFTQGQPPTKAHIPIYDHWKTTGSKSASHFYAFYFDRVGATYIEAVNNAFLNMDHEDYSKYLKESWNILGVLTSLFKNLMNSSYEARYADHLKKYREVRQLLIKEKQKQDAS
jgi:hypothetical protein